VRDSRAAQDVGFDRMTKRAFLLSLLMVLPFGTTRAENPAPEIVLVDKVTVDGDVKRIMMEGDTGHYVLFCNLKALGCITPTLRCAITSSPKARCGKCRVQSSQLV